MWLSEHLLFCIFACLFSSVLNIKHVLRLAESTYYPFSALLHLYGYRSDVVILLLSTVSKFDLFWGQWVLFLFRNQLELDFRIRCSGCIIPLRCEVLLAFECTAFRSFKDLLYGLFYGLMRPDCPDPKFIFMYALCVVR